MCKQNGEIADANNQTYTINKSGDYYLVASNEFGCSKISELVTIVRTGNNEIKSHNDFLLYPNPVKNKLTIKFQANKFTEVTLLNTMGQQIFRAQIEPDTKQQEINFEKLKSGIFIVNLQNVNEKITSKIVLKK